MCFLAKKTTRFSTFQTTSCWEIPSGHCVINLPYIVTPIYNFRDFSIRAEPRGNTAICLKGGSPLYMMLFCHGNTYEYHIPSPCVLPFAGLRSE